MSRVSGPIDYKIAKNLLTGAPARLSLDSPVWLVNEAPMIISVVNHTNGLIDNRYLAKVIEAINRQIAEDFFPLWDMLATLRLRPGPPYAPLPLEPAGPPDARDDAVIYLWHPVEVRRGLGFHAVNSLGIPYGFVFPAVSGRLHEPWEVTLSHEALEMTADPETNLLVMGPNPYDRRWTVFHWYEVCDAVQTEVYYKAGVPVSNFVLPLYFTNREEVPSQNDFMDLRHPTGRLRSFGVNPGGYQGFYDYRIDRHATYRLEGDSVAFDRVQVKQSLQLTRRSQRYKLRTGLNAPLSTIIKGYLATQP